MSRHRFEQYFTSSQTLAHLRRQVKGRPQVTQVLTGKSPFLRIFAISICPFACSPVPPLLT